MNKADRAHDAGTHGEALPFSATTLDEQIAYDKGRNAALGLGGANLLMILAFGPIILTILGCFWPLMGIVTYASWTLTKDFFIAHFPGQGILTLFATFAAGGSGLYLSLKAERWLEQFAVYLIVRRIARFFALMVFYVYFTLTFYGPRYFPDPITLEWIDKQLTIRDYIAMIAIAVVGHYVSRALEGRFFSLVGETRLGQGFGHAARGVATSMGLDPAETREHRRARQKRAGLIFGGIGAVFLLLVGETPGSAVLCFLLFGGIGWLVGPFLPQKYFQPREKSEAK